MPFSCQKWSATFSRVCVSESEEISQHITAWWSRQTVVKNTKFHAYFTLLEGGADATVHETSTQLIFRGIIQVIAIVLVGPLRSQAGSESFDRTFPIATNREIRTYLIATVCVFFALCQMVVFVADDLVFSGLRFQTSWQTSSSVRPKHTAYMLQKVIENKAWRVPTEHLSRKPRKPQIRNVQRLQIRNEAVLEPWSTKLLHFCFSRE